MFKIAHFYPKELNLYGDNGNILYLRYLLKLFGIKSSITTFSIGDKPSRSFDLIFMGGGPDDLQLAIYEDLFTKKDFFKDHIELGKPALFICGSYQLIGEYYQAATGKKIKGLSLFSFYTKAPTTQDRLVGNVVSDLPKEFSKNMYFSKNLVGFENHNGRTYLKGNKGFASTTISKGNNTKDSTEGFLYKKTIGTYLHGPILVKNPHIALFLLENYIPLKFKEPLFSEYIAHQNIIKQYSD